MKTPDQNNKVILWTLILCFMVMIMVIIGGVTRLTGSGLSIVEWKPLMGAIPPLSLEDWNEVFAKYQASPQYKLVNHGMSLSEFQWIYFWEYFHRLMGRLLGVAFLIPWLVFWKKRFISNKMAMKFLFGFLLGGLQGLMGWIMVASGLVNQPHVSHFRLAAHLALAFFILAYYWRLIWELNQESLAMTELSQRVNQDIHHHHSHPAENLENHTKTNGNQIEKSPATAFSERGIIESGKRINNKNSENDVSIHFLKKALNAVLALLILQIFYGAFVAGLRAGFIANTFPDMQGSFFPLGGWSLSPGWMNILENPLTVQWIHRILAWILLISVVGIYLKARRDKATDFLQKGLLGLVVIIFIQFLFGVSTLLLKVPLPLAVIHQVGAALVLLFILWLRWQVQALSTKLHH